MEAKLHSIPGLEDRKEEPLSSPTVGITAQSEPVKETLGVKASEHPDYIQFFKLLKLGVPISVVQAKVVAANLDPSIIDQPDLVLWFEIVINESKLYYIIIIYHFNGHPDVW